MYFWQFSNDFSNLLPLPAEVLIMFLLYYYYYIQLDALKPGISGSACLLALSVFMCDRKIGYGGHPDFINFNYSLLFSVKCLVTWYISVFGVFRVYWHIVRFHVRPKTKLWRPCSVKYLDTWYMATPMI